jgi:hypothetical protein
MKHESVITQPEQSRFHPCFIIPTCFRNCPGIQDARNRNQALSCRPCPRTKRCNISDHPGRDSYKYHSCRSSYLYHRPLKFSSWFLRFVCRTSTNELRNSLYTHSPMRSTRQRRPLASQSGLQLKVWKELFTTETQRAQRTHRELYDFLCAPSVSSVSLW